MTGLFGCSQPHATIMPSVRNTEGSESYVIDGYVWTDDPLHVIPVHGFHKDRLTALQMVHA